MHTLLFWIYPWFYCSESTLNSEINFISEILVNGDFLLNVVQTVNANKITKFNKIQQASVQKCPVYLRFPRLSVFSVRFTKQIAQTVQSC